MNTVRSGLGTTPVDIDVSVGGVPQAGQRGRASIGERIERGGEVAAMRAMTVVPGRKGSAGVETLDEPSVTQGELLVSGRLVGVCGTDREIADGFCGEPPTGEGRLVLGHEGLGEVLEAPVGSGFGRGDLVVGIVRRPDPVPCPACAAGQWDMCRNDRFIERGIVRGHGYGSQRWRVEPRFAVSLPRALGDLGVLLEPTSVVAKAWDQIDRISNRAFFLGGRGLVCGAGPIGLLACLLGVQRGYEMHVVDLATAGVKRDLVEGLGAHYHAGDAAEVDVDAEVVIECTGVGAVGRAAARRLVSGGIMCLVGLMNVDAAPDVDTTAVIRAMVLRNIVMFGTVNAGRRHWEQAVVALAAADPTWLSAMITRRVPLERWAEALTLGPDDVKVVVELCS